jgi:hypothetical protein
MVCFALFVILSEPLAYFMRFVLYAVLD